MALRPSQHAPSRLSTGVTRKRPRSGAFKEGAQAMECCSEGALCGPGRPQSLHANTHRQGTVVFGIHKVRSTRSLHRPACCLQSPAVVESAADACLDPSIDKSLQCAPSLFAQQTNNCNKLCPPSLFAQQTNNYSKLCPMDVAVTSVRRSDRVHRFANLGQACPSRLSICPLFGCTGHS